MPFLRNVLKDLVDKRLWPVAVLLVGALVAVPVLLGRSSGDGAAPATSAANTPTAVADAGTASKVKVTLDDGAADVDHLTGPVRDPFRAPEVKRAKTTKAEPAKSAAAAATPAATVTTGATGADPAGSTGSGSTPTSTGSGSTPPTGSAGTGTSGTGGTTTTPKTPAKTTTTTPKAEHTTDTYHVSVRFGLDGGKLTTIRDVARLSPLPSVTDPFFVYLGVLKVDSSKTKRAVFIVSSDATPNGEGACHPTKQDCETVELTVGQTAYFDSTAPDGKVTQYELQLAGIHKIAVKSEAKASAAFARHSVAGAELLRDAATRKVRAAAGARAYRYLPGAGLLVRAKRRHVTARAAAAGTLIPGLALVARKDQPGIPVWHSPDK